MPTADIEKRFLTTKGVAERYNRSTRTIARWVIQGVLPPPDLTINDKHLWSGETLAGFEQRAKGAA
jgi:hypothetical protein